MKSRFSLLKVHRYRKKDKFFFLITHHLSLTDDISLFGLMPEAKFRRKPQSIILAAGVDPPKKIKKIKKISRPTNRSTADLQITDYVTLTLRATCGQEFLKIPFKDVSYSHQQVQRKDANDRRRKK